MICHYRDLSKTCFVSIACFMLAACGTPERAIDSGYQNRTISGTEFGLQRHGAEVSPRTAVDAVRVDVTVLKRQQRRYYRTYRNRGRRYGSWNTRKTVKGKKTPAPNVRLYLTSVSKGLTAGFVDGKDRTNSDGLVFVRSKLKDPFKVFADAPLEAVIRHPAIAKPELRRSDRKREWFQLKADRKSAKKRLYRLRRYSYDIRPTLKKVARQVHAEKTIDVRIVPANIDSRYPVGRARITLSSLKSVDTHPSDWLKKYLKYNEYLSYASEHFPSFVKRNWVKESGPGGAVFRVAPGPHKITISHPKYYFLEKTIGLSRAQTEVRILMSELGTKHRVKILY